MKAGVTTKIRIKLESFNPELLEISCKKITSLIKDNNINNYGIISLPTDKRIYCVLKSPHVYKDSREHFEIRVHKRLIETIIDSSSSIFDLITTINLPSGVISRIDLF